MPIRPLLPSPVLFDVERRLRSSPIDGATGLTGLLL